MTRLTKSMKDAFVRAVMDDVPEVNYVEQAEKLVRDFFVSKMPPKVRAVYDDAELRDKYIKTSHVYALSESHVLCCVHGDNIARDKWPKKLLGELADLDAKHSTQHKERRALRAKVSAMIAGMNTRAAVEKTAPELVKYLSPEPEKIKNLPSATTVVTDLMNAGWPK